MRFEDPVLLLLTQPSEERHDLDARRVMATQMLRRLADLALAGQEDQDVAGARMRIAPQLVDAGRDRVVQIELAALLERAPALLDREETAGNLDDGRRAR